MKKIERNIIYKENYIEVILYGNSYIKTVLLDNEDIIYINGLYISNNGYVLYKNKLLHRILLNCENNLDVDHINGNRLDNRKHNLRKVSKSINERNKHEFIRNNTGVIGIQYRENGIYKYYRVSWRDNDSIRYTKQFNINTYGKDLAFDMAKSLLLEQQQKYKYLTQTHIK